MSHPPPRKIRQRPEPGDRDFRTDLMRFAKTAAAHSGPREPWSRRRRNRLEIGAALVGCTGLGRGATAHGVHHVRGEVTAQHDSAPAQKRFDPPLEPGDDPDLDRVKTPAGRASRGSGRRDRDADGDQRGAGHERDRERLAEELGQLAGLCQDDSATSCAGRACTPGYRRGAPGIPIVELGRKSRSTRWAMYGW